MAALAVLNVLRIQQGRIKFNKSNGKYIYNHIRMISEGLTGVMMLKM